MADDAAFGENLAAGSQLRRPRHALAFQLAKLLASGRVFQAHRASRFEEKLREVIDVVLGHLPIDRVLFDIGDFERLLLSEADQNVGKSDPTLREQTDI